MSVTPIRFIDPIKERNLFFATLRQRVDAYFKEKNISKHYNSTMVIKTIVLLAGYLIPFIALLTFNVTATVNFILWFVMGLAMAGIGMSIMHDANHGAYSSNSKVNLWLGHTLNMVGGAVFNWKLQHNLMHHTYTNIVNLDEDIDDKLIMKFSPHNKAKWYHKFQFLYSFVFYGILTLYWALLKDLVQFIKFTKSGVNKNTTQQNLILLLKITVGKLFYFGILVILPIFVFHVPTFYVIGGFVLMQFVAGLILTVIFQLAHTVEETSHPLPNEEGTIENAWAIHQLNTTVNFSRKNKFISWYVGGLNFQVEHHLFPTICHVHYPEIAPIVKATAEEYGVPYLENITFMDALKSHISALKRFGKLPSLNEAIG